MGDVEIGTVVRFDLHGRRLRGWVTAIDVVPPPDLELRPLTKVTGHGPSADVLDLAGWAAWRWAGRRAHLLRTASPPRAVTRLGPTVVRADTASVTVGDPLVGAAFEERVGVVALPPGADAFPFVHAASSRGQALVLAPSLDGARALGVRLRRAGVPVASMERDWAQAASGATVVGGRAAAWAPAPDLAAAVVVDEHDEVYQEERTPTWHARDVVIERARRAGVPCVLLSPMPTPEARAVGTVLTPSRRAERDGWPLVDVLDRRRDDGSRGGLYASALVDRLRAADTAVCVLNRKGRSRLLACAACGTIAVCEVCGSSMVQGDESELVCRTGDSHRPLVCQECGKTVLKNLRVGVARAREELEALVRRPVVEVSGADGEVLPDAGVFVGTEAVLHRVHRADVVAFLDFDQELLAPRYRAGEEALGLVVRAARLVGPRSGGGRVVLQTRLPRHDVVLAALHANPARLAEHDTAVRRELGYPPATALALVSGQAAEAFVRQLGRPLGVEVLGPTDGRWLLRAPDHRTLCDALAATPRPPGRLRLEVDPLRV